MEPTEITMEKKNFKGNIEYDNRKDELKYPSSILLEISHQKDQTRPNRSRGFLKCICKIHICRKTDKMVADQINFQSMDGDAKSHPKANRFADNNAWTLLDRHRVGMIVHWLKTYVCHSGNNCEHSMKKLRFV